MLIRTPPAPWTRHVAQLPIFDATKTAWSRYRRIRRESRPEANAVNCAVVQQSEIDFGRNEFHLRT